MFLCGYMSLSTTVCLSWNTSQLSTLVDNCYKRESLIYFSWFRSYPEAVLKVLIIPGTGGILKIGWITNYLGSPLISYLKDIYGIGH